jgi:2-iminobutanoate/2-iminopropanoate deaminase
MARDGINSAQLTTPVGPYSHAVNAGEFVFLSGQIAQDQTTGKLIEGDVAAQTEQVFANLKTVLESCGKTLEDVVKCNVFLIDMNDFVAMNTIYVSQFAAPFPARSTVAVAALPLGARVEIELIAH